MAKRKLSVDEEIEVNVPVSNDKPVEVEPVKEPVKESKTHKFVGTVNCMLLNVRADKSLNSTVVRTVTSGTPLNLTETSDPKWLAVSTGGYVLAEFINR